MKTCCHSKKYIYRTIESRHGYHSENKATIFRQMTTIYRKNGWPFKTRMPSKNGKPPTIRNLNVFGIWAPTVFRYPLYFFEDWHTCTRGALKEATVYRPSFARRHCWSYCRTSSSWRRDGVRHQQFSFRQPLLVRPDTRKRNYRCPNNRHLN